MPQACAKCDLTLLDPQVDCCPGCGADLTADYSRGYVPPDPAELAASKQRHPSHDVPNYEEVSVADARLESEEKFWPVTYSSHGVKILEWVIARSHNAAWEAVYGWFLCNGMPITDDQGKGFPGTYGTDRVLAIKAATHVGESQYEPPRIVPQDRFLHKLSGMKKV